MSRVLKQKIMNNSRCCLKRFKKLSADFSSVWNFLEERSDFFLVGGFLRDMLFEEVPRDIDILIKAFPEGFSSVIEALPSGVLKRNRFGGYKFIFENIELDLWSFKQNWSFREGLVEELSDNIHEGCFFNIDSMVFDYKRQEIYFDSFYESFKDGTLDFSMDDENYVNSNPSHDMNILRSILLAQKYNLKWSGNVKDYINEWVKKPTQEIYHTLSSLQHQHYGKSLLDQNALANSLSSFLQKRPAVLCR